MASLDVHRSVVLWYNRNMRFLSPEKGKNPLISKPLVAFQLFGITLGIFVLSLYVNYAFSSPIAVVPQTIVIQKNASAREVAETLKANGLIRSEYIFLGYLYITGKEKNIIPGTYTINTNFSLADIASEITTSSPHNELSVRIQEGTSLKGIADIFEQQSLFTKEDFWNITGVPGTDFRLKQEPYPDIEKFTTEFPFLADKPAKAGLEGYLFPDSYRFYDNATPHDVVEKMLQNFQDKLTSAGIFDEIQQQGRSVYEVLTLASLLEREANLYTDKQIIAGIIQKRIREGMPIQIDATLGYVTGRGSAGLTQDDLASASPYNSYKFLGLPIGPITNPGLESIKAALEPKKTAYYFYLSDNNGKMYYSVTNAEHAYKKSLYVH